MSFAIVYLGPGQSMLPSQFLPGPSGSQSQPPSSHPHQPIPPRHLHPALSQPRQQYHTAMTDSAPPLSSPHMPISLWNAQQSHPHEFASLMVTLSHLNASGSLCICVYIVSILPSMGVALRLLRYARCV